MIVLEDPTLVNQTLLIGRDVAVGGNRLLEGSDGGIEGNLNGKLGTIGAANVDVDVDTVGGVRLRGTFSGSFTTSHGVVVGSKHGRRIRSHSTGLNRKRNRNPNPRTIGEEEEAKSEILSWEFEK